jgi:hypothetical protein
MADGYTRIAGGSRSGRLSFSAHSLWRGIDHLLLVERDAFYENYKRFHFADIESITIRQTKAHQVYSIICIVLIVFFTWIAVVSSGFGRYFSEFWIAFFAIPLIVNLTLGPTCVTQLSTAVQREELPLRRVRKAQQLLEAIKTAVAATQGAIEPEVARAQYRLRTLPPPIAPPPLPQADAGGLPEIPLDIPPPA